MLAAKQNVLVRACYRCGISSRDWFHQHTQLQQQQLAVANDSDCGNSTKGRIPE